MPNKPLSKSEAAAMLGKKGGAAGTGDKKRRPASHYRKLAQLKKARARERKLKAQKPA